MPPRRVLDSHFHIYDLKVRASFPRQNVSHGFPGPSQEAIHRNVDIVEAEVEASGNNVRDAVFVACYNDCPEEVRWVLGEAKNHAFLKGVVGGLDPTKHEELNKCIEEFKDYEHPKFVGIRHLISFEDVDYLTREDVHKGLAILQDNSLTFDLQSYPNTLRHIPLLAAKFPRLKMVIDHFGKPFLDGAAAFDGWCQDISAAAKFENVFMKISGMDWSGVWSPGCFQPYVDHVVKEFGTKRCMFGTNWPVCKLDLTKPMAEYKDVVQLVDKLLEGLTEEEKEDIFYNNAVHFYNLTNVS